MKRSFITHTATIALSTILLAITVLAQSQASRVDQEKTLPGDGLLLDVNFRLDHGDRSDPTDRFAIARVARK